MKSVFYIVSFDTGEVFGTDDAEVVQEYIDNGDFVVIDTNSGDYWDGGFQKETQPLPNTELEVGGENG